MPYSDVRKAAGELVLEMCIPTISTTGYMLFIKQAVFKMPFIRKPQCYLIQSKTPGFDAKSLLKFNRTETVWVDVIESLVH